MLQFGRPCACASGILGRAGAALPAAEEVLAPADQVLRHDLPLLVRDSGYVPLGPPAGGASLWAGVAAASPV